MVLPSRSAAASAVIVLAVALILLDRADDEVPAIAERSIAQRSLCADRRLADIVAHHVHQLAHLRHLRDVGRVHLLQLRDVVEDGFELRTETLTLLFPASLP